LTLAAPGLASGECVSEWDFNYKGQITTLTYTRGALVGIAADNGKTGDNFEYNPTIGIGLDAYQADGDGKYDVSFQFLTSDGLILDLA